MIDCKHLEWIDVTPWHGDVFDHPSYKSVCRLKNKDVHHFYSCALCKDYVPDYERLSDSDIRYELRIVKKYLEEDDRIQPMSAALVSQLIDRRNKLLEEAAKRKLTFL